MVRFKLNISCYLIDEFLISIGMQIIRTQNMYNFNVYKLIVINRIFARLSCITTSSVPIMLNFEYA